MLAGGIPGATAHSLEALPESASSAEVAAWLAAAAALGTSTDSFLERARVEPAVARVAVSHALRFGDPAQAAALALAGWEGGTAPGVASWPRQLDAVGEVAAAVQLRTSATPTGAAAVAVADRAPDAVARVLGLGTVAAHLAPAALLDAAQPCEAWEAVERVSLDRLGDVPRLGDVGYGAWTAGCWSGDVPVRLRLAQALEPADGRVAHVLGLARAASGDAAGAQALLAQARWALPQDARLQADLVRLYPAPEDHR